MVTADRCAQRVRVSSLRRSDPVAFQTMKESAQALGLDQAKVMSECVERRYPRTERAAQAVWRGTNTDHHGADRLTAAKWLSNLRVQLVLRAFGQRAHAVKSD